MTSHAVSAAVQGRIKKLQSHFEEWTSSLPGNVQEKLTKDVLSSLAAYILNDTTIYEIVNSLMDIQHIIERELNNKRIDLQNRQSGEIAWLKALKLPSEEHNERLVDMRVRHSDEMKQCLVNIILDLDEKVTEQQLTLERAGVPYFHATNDPVEIRVQMHVIDFIIRSRTI